MYGSAFQKRLSSIENILDLPRDYLSHGHPFTRILAEDLGLDIKGIVGDAWILANEAALAADPVEGPHEHGIPAIYEGGKDDQIWMLDNIQAKVEELKRALQPIRGLFFSDTLVEAPATTGEEIEGAAEQREAEQMVQNILDDTLDHLRERLHESRLRGWFDDERQTDAARRKMLEGKKDPTPQEEAQLLYLEIEQSLNKALEKCKKTRQTIVNPRQR